MGMKNTPGIQLEDMDKLTQRSDMSRPIAGMRKNHFSSKRQWENGGLDNLKYLSGDVLESGDMVDSPKQSRLFGHPINH
jgi:hypothetical protein